MKQFYFLLFFYFHYSFLCNISLTYFPRVVQGHFGSVVFYFLRELFELLLIKFKNIIPYGIVSQFMIWKQVLNS